MKDFLEQLNDSQREAVLYTEGPLMVIAGAGSGKTRVLTYKIAHLLNKGMEANHILALTFTNKAAREMRERIDQIVGESTGRRLWMGTFHSIFSRILRIESSLLGFSSSFTIYDSTDSKNLVKSIIKEMQLDDKIYRPGVVQNRISNAKNALISWRSYAQTKDLIEQDNHSRMPLIREIYRQYQARCFQAGAMDFDDLLMYTNILFRDHPEILAKYQHIFQYVLVDEYQDTNFAQHLIVTRLCEKHRRICVVGDDAQSIYSFRGANIDNMLKFKQVYPECKYIKLEQNYRSTQNIVNAANSLIRKNKEQIAKTVFSENEPGEKIELYSAFSDYEEGYSVAMRIKDMQYGSKHYSYEDFAVLYRTNAQSRILEEALRKLNIPYKIYGGLSFYQRKEIKDVIAYMRLLVNPHDEEAIKRVINYPTRGIGEVTVNKLKEAAIKHNTSLWTVIENPQKYEVDINKGTGKKIGLFHQMMQELMDENLKTEAEVITTQIIKKTGIASSFVMDNSVEGKSKQQNLEELVKGVAEYTQLRKEEGREQVALADFLSEIALLTDQDNDREENSNKVTLMTIHAAKGLEFNNVFIVGLEEELFPSHFSSSNEREIEEERRLFYVAITRAKENCVLTYSKSRFRNGQSTQCRPSRFLSDIDPRFLKAKLEQQVSEKENSSYQSPAASSLRKLRPLKEPTTQAAPATPAPQEGVLVDTIGELKVGSIVSHSRFGKGEVLSLENDPEKAVVDFKNVGEKKLLLKFARLTIIE